MKLGFYYHVPLSIKEGKLYVPGFLGVFLDSLALEVDTLYLFMHSATEQQAGEADYELQQRNIEFTSLGVITPAWHRHLFHKRILNRIAAVTELCDVIIIRSPTPLAPFFKNSIHNNPKLTFMVVGDYLEGAKHFKRKSIRDWVMTEYLKRNDFLFRKQMQHTDVLVNSPMLLNKYEHLSKSIHLIKTTTLKQDDFFQRQDTCQNDVIELLYTGRIEAAKGLFELVESLGYLRSKGINARLNIVGWEADGEKVIENSLKKKANELEVGESVFFHGKKRIGAELNEMYRQADLYIIPSHHEGFPRTIWEAMANSLPVIATRVGSIPSYLAHKRNAFLIEPKNVDEINMAVQVLLKDGVLRKSLIGEGYLIAKENTLEFQTRLLVNIIKNVAIN